MPKIDPAACPERTGTLYPEPYRATVRGRRLRQIGVAVGLTDFGANVVTLDPGVWSSQRHWHEEADELMVMLEGEAVLIEDEGRTLLHPGDIVAWPKSVANGHHIVNESAAAARFLVMGHGRGDCFYPDCDMIAKEGESFYRHRDGTPYRQYAREE
jgi:uncharacterized cupin superfamily protein